MSDAEDLIYFPPKRKFVSRSFGRGDASWNPGALAGFHAEGFGSGLWSPQGRGSSLASSGSSASAISALGRGRSFASSGSSTSALTTSVGYSLASIISTLGARLIWFFEVGVSGESLDGSNNYSQLNDLGPGAYHATQSTAGSRPNKTVGGGPNGKNCISFGSTSQHLFSTAMSLSAGRALTFFAVTKRTSAAGFRVSCSARTGNGVSLGSSVFYTGADANNNGFETATKCNGVAGEDRVLTSPVADTNWRVWSTRYAAGVPPVIKSNNSATAPLFTTAGVCDVVEVAVIGHPSVAAGHFYLFACVEDCTAGEEDAIRSYILSQTGL